MYQHEAKLLINVDHSLNKILSANGVEIETFLNDIIKKEIKRIKNKDSAHVNNVNMIVRLLLSDEGPQSKSLLVSEMEVGHHVTIKDIPEEGIRVYSYDIRHFHEAQGFSLTITRNNENAIVKLAWATAGSKTGNRLGNYEISDTASHDIAVANLFECISTLSLKL